MITDEMRAARFALDHCQSWDDAKLLEELFFFLDILGLVPEPEPEPKQLSTHCIRGHRFSPENTYSPPDNPNKRTCRKCTRDRKRANNPPQPCKLCGGPKNDLSVGAKLCLSCRAVPKSKRKQLAEGLGRLAEFEAYCAKQRGPHNG